MKDVVAAARLRATLLKQRRQPGGTECPVCKTHFQEYHFPFNTGMARLLVIAYRIHGQEWFDLPRLEQDYLGRRNGHFGKTRHWGLTETIPTRDDGGKGPWWRVTTKGALFVQGKISIPSHAWLPPRGECGGLDGERKFIHELTGVGFDLDKLLQGTA